MHPLAGRRAAKMNGIGNAIVVLDLRGSAAQVDEDAARAIHRAPRLAYDQLMVLADPRSPGTEAFVSIFNNDGTQAEACGNGTRCVAAVLGRAGAPARLVVETAAGRLACKRLGADRYSVDMGEPAPALGRDPARRAVRRHARHRAADRGRSTRPCCTRRRSSTWATRMRYFSSGTSRPTISRASARCSKTIRSFPNAPTFRSRRSRRPIGSACGCGNAASG